MRARALAAFLLLLAPAARADAPVEKPVQSYGEDHPACLEWTDGCIVCARRDGEEAACSMVGAACLPAAVACLESR